MRLLFVGDSITHAYRKNDELNPAFQLGNGYVFLIASRLASQFPDREYTFINKSVCGDGVRDLALRWESDVIAQKPDCLTLYIGVNDTVGPTRSGSVLSDDEFSSIYQQLLERLSEECPQTLIILIEPFLLLTGNVTEAWLAHIKGRQQRISKIASQRKLPLLHLQGRFDETCTLQDPAYWAWDGIHPTHAGFQLIAEAWLSLAAKLNLLELSSSLRDI